MLDLIKKHLEDLSTGNWDLYRASLADNAIYEEVSTQQRVKGANEYVALIQRWKKAFPISEPPCSTRWRPATR